MDRRKFIGSLAVGAIAVNHGVSAQPTRKVYRIGILGNAAAADMVGPEPRTPSIAALLRGLRELGYVYGEQFSTEVRGSDGKPERFPRLAAELVGLQPDVIVAPGTAMRALKQATSTIPIVMAVASDPVGSGYVQSLAHPGGNITGLSNQAIETTGKRLELLKELVPSSALVAVLWERLNVQYWQAAETAARERGWKLLSLEIRDGDDIEAVFKAATAARAGALLVFAAAHLFQQARRVAELAARNRLPAMYELRAYVEAGGLMSYGADIVEAWQRAAVFVDKILKGAKAADLSVEQPTKFELVINLKAAKALGLAIPQSLRVQAVLIE
jgi:putative tryptophan/tyrosine transport system substrate-binding protein